MVGWLAYALGVLIVSLVVGAHLGRFRQAYTEMTGMMAGMTMGMLNGFLLGYAAGAATNSMFWGNLFGVLLGLAMGAYFGRAGGLMGIMDGGMGGVMGGSMGAMLALMLVFPREGVLWTALLLALIYTAGMAGLVALIEQSAPQHAALHRLLPVFTRTVRKEVAEEREGREEHHVWTERGGLATYEQSTPSRGGSQAPRPPRRLIDYYALLGVPRDASSREISEAYLETLAGLDESDQGAAERLERALAVLTNPHKRRSYDLRLAEATTEARENKAVAASSAAPVQRAKEATVRVTSGERPGDLDDSGEPPRSPEPAQGIVARPVRARSGSPDPGPAGGGRSGAANGQGRAGRAGRAGRGQDPGRGKGAPEARGAQVPDGKRSHGQHQGSGDGRARAAKKQQGRYARGRQHVEQSRVISIPWAGAVATILLLCALGWWTLSAASSSAIGRSPTGSADGSAGGASAYSQAAAQLEAQAVVAPMGADGKQTLDLVVNGDVRSYEPQVIKVKLGVPVRFNLSTKGRDPG